MVDRIKRDAEDDDVNEELNADMIKAEIPIRYLQQQATEERLDAKIKSRLDSGEFIIKEGVVVCSECGSNCGQCGITDVYGAPAPEGYVEKKPFTEQVKKSFLDKFRRRT